MRGSILSYNQNRGLISGQDGNRYEFVRMDWAGQGEPAAGAEVDFIGEGNLAKNVFPLQVGSKHSKIVLAIVCWFFGVLGVHRFMVGKIGTGILMLVLTLTVIGIFITAIWALIDFIVILMGNFTDKDGNKIDSERI
ncbi:TM2 domain-containing protein [Bartonella sp. LJL80]